MRTLQLALCLALVGVAISQNFRGFRGFRGGRPQQQQFRQRPQQFRQRPQQQFRPRPQQNFRPQQQVVQQQRPQQQQPQQQDGLFYSWKDAKFGRRKFSWGAANRECQGLGKQLVSLDNPSRNAEVYREISAANIAYIWTGGERNRGTNSFTFKNGQTVDARNRNWSHTGGANQPQPDNRERSGENCLAVLNNFYQDGIKWHDVACSHTKPFVCE